MKRTRPPQNVASEVSARQKSSKKRNLLDVNEHFEKIFNEAETSAAVLKQSELAGIALAQTCATLLEDKKAEDVRILNIAELSSYTDHLVICSGTGRRHVPALTHHVIRELKRRGKRPLGVEGERGQETGIEEGSWVLLDYGDTIIHVFTPQARAHYDIEGLWADAPRVKPVKPSSAPKTR